MASRDFAGDLANAILRLLPQKIAELEEVQDLGEEYFTENPSSDLDPSTTVADRLNNVFTQYLKTLETEIPLHLDEYLQEEVKNLPESRLDSEDRPSSLSTDEPVPLQEPKSEEFPTPPIEANTSSDFVDEVQKSDTSAKYSSGVEGLNDFEAKNELADPTTLGGPNDGEVTSNSKEEPPITDDKVTRNLDIEDTIRELPEETAVISSALESETETTIPPLVNPLANCAVQHDDGAVLPSPQNQLPIPSQSTNPAPSTTDEETSTNGNLGKKAPSSPTLTPSNLVTPQTSIGVVQTPCLPQDEVDTTSHTPKEQQDPEPVDGHPKFPEPIPTGSETEALRDNLLHNPAPPSEELDNDFPSAGSDQPNGLEEQAALKDTSSSAPEEEETGLHTHLPSKQGTSPPIYPSDKEETNLKSPTEPIKNVSDLPNTNTPPNLDIGTGNGATTENAGDKENLPSNAEPSHGPNTEEKTANVGDFELARGVGSLEPPPAEKEPSIEGTMEGPIVTKDITEKSQPKDVTIEPETASPGKPSGSPGDSEMSQNTQNKVQPTGNNSEDSKMTDSNDLLPVKTHEKPEPEQDPKPKDITPTHTQTEPTEPQSSTELQKTIESTETSEKVSKPVVNAAQENSNDKSHVAQNPQRKPPRTKPNKLQTKFNKATEEASHRKSPLPESKPSVSFEEPPDLDELPWNPYNGDYSTADLRRSKGRQHHRKHSSVNIHPPTPRPDPDSEDEDPTEEPEEDDLDLDDNIKKGNAKLRKSAKSKHHNLDSPLDSPDKDLPSPTTRRKGAPVNFHKNNSKYAQKRTRH
ncbi:hypothetical protein TWF694_010451 [Orbilia ellipsospora]|uniref:Uncharacterized protein n=1 Tax=Orbilia ellipsospora TaxID=2528407 RepID=A0AAV9XAU5_9PEZI